MFVKVTGFKKQRASANNVFQNSRTIIRTYLLSNKIVTPYNTSKMTLTT